MTFTEAAVEVLRRAGKPLHFKDITAHAVEAGLLSHQGQTPEETMASRLLAMARREHDRKVVSPQPGVFGLAEWGIPQEEEPVLDTADRADEEGAPAYRSRERHPPLQKELVVGRREERRRRDADEEGRRKRRYPRPAEVAQQWLREKKEAVTLAELAAALRAQDKIAEALERDLGSFEKALREENRRREESRRPALFAFEKDRIRLLEPSEQPARERPSKVERKEKREPVAARLPLVEEQVRAVVRSIRRRFSSLDASAVEKLGVALVEAQGFKDVNLTRRNAKEGPLYLARKRWGANELRYVVRILRPGRDLGRSEVQDARRDLAHFSAQLAVVLTTGECTRDAKSEANSPGLAPVMLYGGEALADALVEAGLGVTRRIIEVPEYDDEFFSAIGAGENLAEEEVAEPAAASEPPPAGEEREKDKKERSRRRDRRRRGRDSERGEKPAETEGGKAAAADEVLASPPAASVTSPETEVPSAETLPTENEVPSGDTDADAPAENAQPPSQAAPPSDASAPAKEEPTETASLEAPPATEVQPSPEPVSPPPAPEFEGEAESAERPKEPEPS